MSKTVGKIGRVIKRQNGSPIITRFLNELTQTIHFLVIFTLDGYVIPFLLGIWEFILTCIISLTFENPVAE